MGFSLWRSPPQAANDISARLHLLQDACDYGWLLPTSELAQVLQLSPKTLIHHKSYQRYGFTFTKIGRSGAESAWEVKKQLSCAIRSPDNRQKCLMMAGLG